LQHHVFQGLTQPRILEQEVDVQCPEDAYPGKIIDWAVEGPDGQCHDWTVRSKAALEFYRLRVADCPLARTCQGQTAHWALQCKLNSTARYFGQFGFQCMHYCIMSHQVPDGAVPGRFYKMTVPVVAPEDRAVCSGDEPHEPLPAIYCRTPFGSF
jgi:hypothetical protein